jgi:S1-C subfamily serine protease
VHHGLLRLRDTGRRALRALSTRAAAIRTRDRRRLGVALALTCVTLLVAGVAYAATSLVVGGADHSSPAASKSPPWLGVDLSNSSIVGAVVDDVVAGSPGQLAGLQPGDVITQIGSQPVARPSDVTSALAGMHPGDQVAIDFQRGQTTYTTHAVLRTRPGHAP